MTLTSRNLYKCKQVVYNNFLFCLCCTCCVVVACLLVYLEKSHRKHRFLEGYFTLGWNPLIGIFMTNSVSEQVSANCNRVHLYLEFILAKESKVNFHLHFAFELWSNCGKKI